MYFAGTMSSTTESILSPNATNELSNEFLESVSIIFFLVHHLYGYSEVKKKKKKKKTFTWKSFKTMLKTVLVTHLH